MKIDWDCKIHMSRKDVHIVDVKIKMNKKIM